MFLHPVEIIDYVNNHVDKRQINIILECIYNILKKDLSLSHWIKPTFMIKINLLLNYVLFDIRS